MKNLQHNVHHEILTHLHQIFSRVSELIPFNSSTVTKCKRKAKSQEFIQIRPSLQINAILSETSWKRGISLRHTFSQYRICRTLYILASMSTFAERFPIAIIGR